MTSAERVAVVGTGLIGTSIAMAAARAGDQVRGFDADEGALAVAAERSGLSAASSLEACVEGATLVFVCTPVPALAQLVVESLRRSRGRGRDRRREREVSPHGRGRAGRRGR